jgi:exodeoxyribonuclease VII large subunit
VTWDLFSSAAAEPKDPPLNETRNAEVARRVAAQQADAGFPDPFDPAPLAELVRTGRGGKGAKGTKAAKSPKTAKRGGRAAAAIPGFDALPAIDPELEEEGALPATGRAPEGGWTPSTINAAARALIEGMFPPLWVNGEVSNFTRARSGHCYFNLRDRDAQIRCVMWRTEAGRLPTAPTEGMAVRALGKLTLYEGRGEFQMVVAELEAKGEGLFKLAIDRLRTKLETEGLTSPARKRPLPPHPACVGVVTSSAGAALRDVISVIRRRAPWTRIVLSAARVQGEGAAEEIAAAIRRIGAAGCADVLIVGRGGGSIEDLWAFNEEVVARAIAESPVPVISAVGHETDFTIADLVADLRAPTPSAAAEAAVPDRAALVRALAELRERMARCTAERVDGLRERLFEARLDLRDARERLVAGRRDRMAALAGRLNALSPLSTLARGYAVPLDPAGRVLRRAADFAPGAELRLRVVDGSVACRVEGSEAESEVGDGAGGAR